MMVLMTIVVSFIYLFYGYLSYSLENFMKTEKYSMQVNNFRYLLNDDFLTSQYIYKANSSQVKIISYDNKSILYYQKGDYFYRNSNNHIDSLNVKQVEWKFLNDSVKTTRIIDRIEIVSEFEDEEVKLFFQKKYYATILMNNL